MIGGIVETSALFEARTAPRSYPTVGGGNPHSYRDQLHRNEYIHTRPTLLHVPHCSKQCGDHLAWGARPLFFVLDI
jgi:hypothetical protein